MENELSFDIAPDELEIFLEDVNECLQAMEAGILNLEQKADLKTLNSIFRAAHTLKALAGTVGHRQMAELTHTLETIFDALREATLSPTQAITDDLLATVDILKALRDEIVTGRASGVNVAACLERLHALQEDDDLEEEQSTVSLPISRQLTPAQMAQIKEAHKAGQTILEVDVVAAEDAFAPAARLYQTVMALMEVGQILAQEPALEAFSEQDERLWLVLVTQAKASAIEDLLGEIADLAEFQVRPCHLDDRPAPTPARSGNKQKDGPDSGPSLDKTVRISVERLDTLMNLVGELVTGRTRLVQIEDMLEAQYGKGDGVGALSEMVAHFNHVVTQLQEEVMRARMLPIASLFNKFPRLVRDAARAAHKEVDLLVEGETTELDRTIIEAIGDPLIHLLRNAIDHGIETPAVRQAAGKPPTGTIHLIAASVEGQIVITVKDDGQGIDPAQIRQTAIRDGLMSEEEIAKLTENELMELIFRPNMSTVVQVTEMSGRGVGLDVVRTNIERLSGSVVVASKVGHGTTFHLTLPLTLALLQTMLVTVRNTLYAIPVTSINGALSMAEATLSTVKGRPALDWQGQIVPLLDLREIFDHPRLPAAPAKGTKASIVLVTWGNLRVGLIVDKIIGQQEIVVKSLSPLIGRVAGLSGATILGDGSIALIIDIPGLTNAVLQMRR